MYSLFSIITNCLKLGIVRLAVYYTQRLAPSESKKRYMLRILFCLEGATSYLAKLPVGYAYAAVTSYMCLITAL